MKKSSYKVLKKLTLTLTACTSISVNAHDSKEHQKEVKVSSPAVAVTGDGEFTYTANPAWGKLESGGQLGPTHGAVVVDKQGLIYVSTDAKESIFVFKPDGALVKTMAPAARGMHQMVIREEDGKEYIYGAQLNAYGGERIQKVVKLDLSGKTLLEIPNEKTGKIKGGVSGMTGVAVAPDGSIFCCMGYGSNLIHKFDSSGKLLMTFGGKGKKKEQLKTPHNLAIDTRFGDARLLVVDREKRRLVHFDLNGKFMGEYAKHLRRPCAVSFHGDYCAVAELESRVTILNKEGAPIAFLGDNPNKKHWANFKVLATEQKLGIFSAPHGLSFDKEGNLYVQDWNATGRATQLILKK